MAKRPLVDGFGITGAEMAVDLDAGANDARSEAIELRIRLFESLVDTHDPGYRMFAEELSCDLPDRALSPQESAGGPGVLSI
jgi:hypothetical protein